MNKIKIAIASDGKELDSEISYRGGRAPYYIIVENDKVVEIIKNPFASGSGGAGWSVAYMLAKGNVKLLIAGRIGPNMRTALNERGIEFKEISGKVKDIIK